MSRPVWLRVLITLWGIWFTTALTEPAGLFACAMHSGMVSPSAVGGMSMPMSGMRMGTMPDETMSLGTLSTGPTPLSGRDAHDGHHAAAHDIASLVVSGASAGASAGTSTRTSTGTSTAAPEPIPEHHCCTCIGQCGATMAVATQVQVVELTVATLDAVTAPGLFRHVHAPLPRAHALPFANGPPPIA